MTHPLLRVAYLARIVVPTPRVDHVVEDTPGKLLSYFHQPGGRDTDLLVVCPACFVQQRVRNVLQLRGDVRRAYASAMSSRVDFLLRRRAHLASCLSSGRCNVSYHQTSTKESNISSDTTHLDHTPCRVKLPYIIRQPYLCLPLRRL